MTQSTNRTEQHVGEWLSGYIDGELTQQEAQRVRLHIEGCPECREQLGQLEALRKEVGGSRLSPLNEDTWREHMNEPAVQLSRGVGWLLLIAGVLGISGLAIYEFVIDTTMPTYIKVISGLVWLGLGALFVSVLWQRLVERKSDKYKDVEI